MSADYFKRQAKDKNQNQPAYGFTRHVAYRIEQVY